jgi:ABC-type transport system involved in multi-copper enzyme maturation permease subunit
MTAMALPRRRWNGLREFGASVSTIMAKELRSRFRGRRAFLVLTAYLAILALLAYGAYLDTAPDARAQAQFGVDVGIGSTGPNASATVGQAIFSALSVFQLLLVAFLAPAFTTGTISLEREKATLDLLITTPMRPGAIVIGKLLSALAFVLLMILAAVPVSALVLMYGGASMEDVLRQQLTLLVSAIGFGVIGLFFSALTKRTQAATVLTYSTVLFLTVGTFFMWRFWTAAAVSATDAPFGPTPTAPEQLLYLNPAVAMIEIVADTEITPGDFGEIMAEIRGFAGYVCDGDTCYPTPIPVDGGGGSAPGVKGGPVVIDGPDVVIIGAGADCPPNARCLEIGAGGVSQPAVAAASGTVTGHYLPRFALAFGALSVLLTLASMRLMVPLPVRFSLRRRRQTTPAEPTPPAAGPTDEETDR